MLLPSPPSEALQDLPYSPLISAAKERKAVDKALVDKAATLHILNVLPQILDNAIELSLNADSESVKLEATKYLLDRVAGKPVDRSQSTSVSLHAHISPEDVKERLTHLVGNNLYAETSQESDGF